MQVERAVIRINRAQARQIAQVLERAPNSATFHLEQTVTASGGEHLYLHDRDLHDPCVLITKAGTRSPRLQSDLDSSARPIWAHRRRGRR